MKKSIRILALIMVIALFSIFALGSGSDSGKKDHTDSGGSGNIAEVTAGEAEEAKTTEKEKKKNYTLGETITFDDFEIALGTDVSYTTVDNQFSDLNGEKIIRIPATIKNVSDETQSFNRFYVKYFGSQGTALSTCSTYFDDPIESSGDLRPGASKDCAFYMVYDGAGVYGIDFDNFSTKLTVEFKLG